MPFELWLSFVVASAILLAIPGPTILTVISYSVAHGQRANMPLVAGVAFGDCTALTISLLGLGTLLATSTIWFTVIKVAGGLYLLYLGIKLFTAKVSLVEAASLIVPSSRWRLFLNTYVVTALNPKGILFFVAFLPQFIDQRADPTFQLWILAATFVVMAIINSSLYSIFAAAAHHLLTSSQAQRSFNVVGGLLLLAAGVWTLLARRAT